MKRTKVTGQMCVGRRRLLPIDVGFDLRLHDMAVKLPDTFDSAAPCHRSRACAPRGHVCGLVAAIKACGLLIEDA